MTLQINGAVALQSKKCHLVCMHCFVPRKGINKTTAQLQTKTKYKGIIGI